MLWALLLKALLLSPTLLYSVDMGNVVIPDTAAINMTGCTQPVLFVFTLLGVLYAALALFSLIRSRKILTFEWRQAQSFYVLIVIQCGLRSVTLFLSCSVLMKGAYYFLLSAPDSLFIISYLMMFWQMLTLFYYAHFDHHFDSSFFRNVAQRPQQSSTSLIFFFLIIVWVGTQVALYVACISGKIDSPAINRELAVANLAVPSVALLSMISFQLKYSGIPLRSQEWKAKLVRMNLILFIWSLGRYFSGCLGLISSNHKDINSPGDTYDTELIVVYLIASEIICLILVLDYGFLQIFQIGNQDHPAITQSLQPLRATGATDEPEEKPRFSVLSIKSTIPAQEVTFISNLQSRTAGFGQLSLCRLKGRDVVCRRLEFTRMSNFVMEELEGELTALQAAGVWGLLPYYGAVFQTPKISIISPYMERGSLYQLLHDPNKRENLKTKLDICRQVAKCMSEMAALQRHHGHLSSHNVLIDTGCVAYVADFGLAKLKKYATITLGYSCKNAWSSPEQLSNKSATLLNVQESDDVYSFGVILWEVLTEKEPFPGIPWQKLVDFVSIQGLRPELPSTVSPTISQLTLSCWNTEKAKRPDFILVTETLRQFLEGEL